MKKIVSIILVICLLTCGISAMAYSAGDSRAVIGADLDESQIAQVYEAFGVNRGDVTELTVTNSEERHYLSGLVEDSIIGTKSISCIYIEMLEEGSGLDITTVNINWCSEDVYVGALATAGITDARVIIAAPFAVSGTAALTGIYRAYEDITGEEISELEKMVSTQELVITSELAQEIGDYDSMTIVNELKLILDMTDDMTDEELREQILSIAKEYDISLTDSQIDQLISLCRALEKLDPDALKEKVESVQDTIKKMAQAKEKVSGFVGTIKTFAEGVSNFVTSVVNWFKSLGRK